MGMMEVFKKLLGQSNEAEVRRLQKIADQVLAKEAEYRALTDEQLQAKTPEFKQRLAAGETLDHLLPDAFAACREAADRTVGLRPYPVQVIGGVCLHQGRIAEMKTGEGKTLVATLPAYLNALTGEGVHIVTVNDYLARRDSEWMGKIYKFMGLTVGLIVHDLDNAQRRAAYACDITYGTNNEMGFDYLRDNMVIHERDMVQRGHVYAIVDEVDSILIDEARTPLIISGQGDKSTDLYEKANQFVSRLKNEEDYTIAEKEKAVSLTEQGVAKAQRAFNVENIADLDNAELYHHILAALKAHAIMKRDVDYVVQNGEVIIVDEFTGRLMVGRRYSDVLHQAIEAKEHVKVERESKTLATITFQNYFRMYKKISGMTGTAKTEEEEFQGIYNLDVVQIPTNKPMIRKDLNDMVYKTKRGKFNAVVEEIVKRHQTGQPILVGTVNVETSEMLSHLIKLRGVSHEVLNAKNHQKEAEIVAQAGHVGAVTIATNMAGRGTDILLGGNPDFLARRAMRQENYPDEIIEAATGHNENVDQVVLDARKRYRELYEGFKKETDAEHERVMALGGLHIIGTERHESRRIDNQLRGRAGRQGDPGETRFYLSLEDDLMRLFGGDRIQNMMERFDLDEDTPIENKMLTKAIENAQTTVESRNFQSRKSVLEYDDVMNKQREIIYDQRRQVLDGKDIKETILSMLRSTISDHVAMAFGENQALDAAGVREMLRGLDGLYFPKGTFHFTEADLAEKTEQDFTDLFCTAAEKTYEAKETEITAPIMRELERVILLRVVDEYWMDHIDAMDDLKQGIRLRAYANTDPVIAYKQESLTMFEEMVAAIQAETVRRMFSVRLKTNEEVKRERVAKGMVENVGGDGTAPKKQPIKVTKIGRNDPCPCGSGLKWKKCTCKDYHPD